MIHINQILQKGDWKVGPPRTINSIKHHLSQHNLKRLKQKGKKGKVQPSNFFNVINEPINIMPESSWGAGDSPTLAGNPPDPLHETVFRQGRTLLDQGCPNFDKKILGASVHEKIEI